MSKPVVLFIIASLLVVSTVFNSRTVLAESYVSEFSEPGEQEFLDSSWSYFNKDGMKCKIDVYSYCYQGSCRIVIFDVYNRNILTLEESINFLQNYKFKDYIDNNSINEEFYRPQFSQSFTCSLIIPEAEKEMKELVTREGLELLSDVLPSNAGKIVSQITKTGKTLGMISSKINYGLLALGAVCVGGDLLEQSASSTLKSCELYVSNIRNKNAYAGQVQDLENCNEEAKRSLDITKWSPNVRIEQGETISGNVIGEASSFLQNLWCTITNSNCTKSDFVPKNSTYDAIDNQINNLNKNFPSLEDVNSWSNQKSTESISRIEQKENEVNNALVSFKTELNIAKNNISSYENNGDIFWKNIIFSPSFDINEINSKLNLANSDYDTVNLLKASYKYNSALGTINEGKSKISAAIIELDRQVSGSWKTPNYLNVFIIIVFVAGLFFFLNRKLGNQNVSHPENFINQEGVIS